MSPQGPDGADRAARPTVAMAVLSRLIPGVGRVHAQKQPFADAWRQANERAELGDGPLWVALGDSMSQGIGSKGIEGSWVSQLHERLTAAGRAFRLINLSVTGARVADLVDTQLPALEALGVTPDLVTVLIGANDMIRRSRREAAVPQFARLIDELHATTTIVATLPRRNPAAMTINAMIDRAAAAGTIRVAEMRGPASLAGLRGTLAEDYFHPNENGYASIADAFAQALDLPPRPG